MDAEVTAEIAFQIPFGDLVIGPWPTPNFHLDEIRKQILVHVAFNPLHYTKKVSCCPLLFPCEGAAFFSLSTLR